MADAVRSNTPTAVILTDLGFEALKLQITNPTPTSGRPAVTVNYVYRRQTGSTGSWTMVGSTGPNSTYSDLYQRSATAYDYFIRTDTGADSITYSATSPNVNGMWAYAANDIGTLAHYPYTDGHNETVDQVETMLQLVGRTYPIVESGVQETHAVAVNVTIPFSDTDWRTQVEWWRSRKRDRQALLYRDGRGRIFATRIIGPVAIAPTRAGATVSCSLQRIDYTAQTTLLDPAYYQAGVYNDGGNGIYGNGLQGNGY